MAAILCQYCYSIPLLLLRFRRRLTLRAGTPPPLHAVPLLPYHLPVTRIVEAALTVDVALATCQHYLLPDRAKAAASTAAHHDIPVRLPQNAYSPATHHNFTYRQAHLW